MKQASTLGYEGRRDKLAPVVKQSYDLPFMAKVAAGKYWKELDAASQQRFIETFTRLTIANYAGRFNGYDGESFVFVSEDDGGQNTTLVRTKLVPKDDPPIQLDYRLRSVDGSWRIIDVHLNGTVSELALRRAEYSAKIERDGFDGLLHALDEKIAALASGSAAD
jgi:phospholipid transport system substrate-binding protein